jgi:predicted nucleotidyltransferase
MTIEEPHLEKIRQLCKAIKVKELFTFGSVIRDGSCEPSDIDFVVDFDEQDPFTYTDLYFTLKFKLEVVLNRQVNLLEERGIRNHILREHVNRTKAIIYSNINVR